MNIITSFLKKGILLSPEVAENSVLIEKLSELDGKNLEHGTVINKNLLIKLGVLPAEQSGSEGKQVLDEKNKDIKDIKNIKDVKNVNGVKVLFSYDKKPSKISVNDFVAYFNKRFETLSSFLRQRHELQKATSINRVKNMRDRENVSIIGMVFKKAITKNNNILLTLEDVSGKATVFISDKNRKLFDTAKDIVLDELIGVTGFKARTLIIANQIFSPDVPLVKELKKSSKDEQVVLLGDPHFGSKVFLKNEFNDFIEWINQRKGSAEQREIASKVKYLICIGDLVEGVGIYPNQEKDLEVKDIKEQYRRFSEYLKKIPTHITIIICPGNHDVGRISEPQQPILSKYAEALQKLPNVILLSNPAFINLAATDDFPGFDFLLYHGYSLIYYSDNVESIRAKGGQKRVDLIMKFLLQKRHLAPTHTSNLYIPDTEHDPLIIDRIPDFFITGHIHRVSVSNYKNITLINCSCWTDITEDTEKRGLQPQPAKVPIINLKTREVKIINFFKTQKPGQKAEQKEGYESEGKAQQEIHNETKIDVVS